MIFALGAPAVAAGMLVGFVLAGLVRAGVVGAVRRRSGGPGASIRQWRTWLDPFGAVAALIAGVGWVGVSDRYRPGRWLATDLVVHGLLAVAGFAGLVATVHSRAILPDLDLGLLLHAQLYPSGVTAQFLAGFAGINLGCGLLSLVPVPPLAGGVLAWTRLPKTPGSRRVAYHLLEEQWGVAVLLVLLILPLANGQSVLLALVSSVGDALLRLAGTGTGLH